MTNESSSDGCRPSQVRLYLDFDDSVTKQLQPRNGGAYRRPGARIASATRLAAISATPPAVSAASKLPVVSRTTPNTTGPTVQPRLPAPLISPMPTPATEIGSTSDGNAQNGPNRPRNAPTDSVRNTTVAYGPNPVANCAQNRNTPLADVAQIICHLRSPRLSELRATSTIITAPAAYGSAVSTPTSP